MEHIENTLPAFRYSARVLKVDLLEASYPITLTIPLTLSQMDVYLTKVEGKISDFEYGELPELLIPNHLKNIVTRGEGTRIPRLEEVFKEFPGYPMQIDVKEGGDDLVLAVGTLILQHTRENQTVWGSFNDKVHLQCYNHFNLRIPCSSLSAAPSSRTPSPLESALILPNLWWFMNKRWFKALNELGITVIVFGYGKDVDGAPGGGINTVEGFERVRKAGVNGIYLEVEAVLMEWCFHAYERKP
ncbi:PLC-like phosphodiesterase [Chytridium lagenaria]|nr:PLC-like phosphodiesterase [Chytridium lagenaria]